MTANPHPRGPCGARLAQPSFTSRGLTVYTSPAGAEVFIWSRRLPGQSVSRLVEAVSAGIRPGCPAFLSRTPYAHDQLNEFLGAVSLPDLGEQRVAFATRVRQNAHGWRRSPPRGRRLRPQDELAMSLEEAVLEQEPLGLGARDRLAVDPLGREPPHPARLDQAGQCGDRGLE
jgi:hypothetical protein